MANNNDDFKQYAHTTLRKRGGAAYVNSLQINSDSSYSVLGARYELSSNELGKMERLAKTIFEVAEFSNEDIEAWERGQFYLAIAHTVNASSEIEGEHIEVDRISLLFNDIDQDGFILNHLTDSERLIAEIYNTYMWALTKDLGSYITYAFVVEAHNRMFRAVRPEIAGKIATEEVIIEGAGYRVETVKAINKDSFLKELCSSTDAKLKKAYRHSEYSMFLVIAEFIIDFLAIHPFSDGNGRLARMLSTVLLERAGYHFAKFYPIDRIILDRRLDYYQALYQSQRNWHTQEEDLSPWIKFYTDAVFEQWNRAYSRVKSKGKIFSFDEL